MSRASDSVTPMAGMAVCGLMVSGFGVLHGVVEQVNQRSAQVGFINIDLGIATNMNLYLGVFHDELQIIQYCCTPLLPPPAIASIPK